MSLETAVAKVVSSVPECVAAGVVDMSTGMLLGVKTVDSHPSEVLDLVAAATSDLFQGDNVVSIEKMFKKTRGIKENDDHHYFREIIVYSDNLLHIFQRGNKKDGIVLVTVCRKNANLGMALVKARSALGGVEAEI